MTLPLRAVQAAQQVPVRRPDGDVELQDAGQGFVVPSCDHCGGTLKPDVVFFGDNIPKVGPEGVGKGWLRTADEQADQSCTRPTET